MLLPRDERTVAGQDEVVEISMLLDVYRFCVEEDEDLGSGMGTDPSTEDDEPPESRVGL